MKTLSRQKHRIASIVTAAFLTVTSMSGALAAGHGTNLSGASVGSVAASAVVASTDPLAARWLWNLGTGAVVTIVAISNLSTKSRMEVRHEGTNETTILEVPTKRVEEVGARVNDPLTVHPIEGGVELKHIGRDFAFVLDAQGKPLLESTRRVRPYHR